ncbi:hypothetical protein LEP1GSC120_3754 [Leptospira santarosai str. 200702252]|nr:hypothetical protein LEP1GSC120_3754 [Leptospira santarosai str. 200702252]
MFRSVERNIEFKKLREMLFTKASQVASHFIYEINSRTAE